MLLLNKKGEKPAQNQMNKHKKISSVKSHLIFWEVLSIQIL